MSMHEAVAGRASGSARPSGADCNLSSVEAYPLEDRLEGWTRKSSQGYQTVDNPISKIERAIESLGLSVEKYENESASETPPACLIDLTDTCIDRHAGTQYGSKNLF
jgi:hypothetical protein